MSFSEDDPQRLLAGPAQRAAMSGEDLAAVLGAMRRRLVAEGFEHAEVWELCREFFMAMIEPGGCDDDDD